MTPLDSAPIEDQTPQQDSRPSRPERLAQAAPAVVAAGLGLALLVVLNSHLKRDEEIRANEAALQDAQDELIATQNRRLALLEVALESQKTYSEALSLKAAALRDSLDSCSSSLEETLATLQTNRFLLKASNVQMEQTANAYHPCSDEQMAIVSAGRQVATELTNSVQFRGALNAECVENSSLWFCSHLEGFQTDLVATIQGSQVFCNPNQGDPMLLGITLRDREVMETGEVFPAQVSLFQVLDDCTLVETLVHEAIHGLTPIEAEPNTDDHDSKQDDFVYHLGDAAEMMCNNLTD